MSDMQNSQVYLLALSVLQSGPAHGYAVIERIKQQSDGELKLPEGTIYPALHNLEGQGLLSSEWQDVEGRRRRVYSLTAAGLRATEERREDWGRFVGAMEAVIGAAR